ncbi:MAG: carboxypeptidase-like regulatory domain-containing protein [Ignavibacteria bacterium]|nr:carboxypeptidase-like regulatory domain-containing protein [Ignavibacteria bacterium]
MKRRLQFFLLIISVVLVGISCNAPRTNPLDPLNPDYNYGTIEGTVLTIGIPSFEISDVKVLWENANLITETDANGRFRLNNIPIKDGDIIFSKDGYKPETLSVAWGSSKRYISLTFLNRIPTLDTVSIYTIIKYDFFPLQSELFVKAWITDLDRDVDSVFVVNETLNLRKPLTYLAAEGNYQTTIMESELNVNDIEQTIGLDFSIIAKDRSVPPNEFIIGSDRITRVIKDEITELHPSTDSTVTSQPVIFNWNEFEAGYDFSYLIEVFSLSSFQLVYTQTNISSDSISYSLPQNLTNGSYYWVIWIVDQFQNRSRSKPAHFRI